MYHLPASPKVLLIEDERVIQYIHTATLKNLGCQVDLSIDGIEAMNKNNLDYHLILIDVGLPGKNGIEVTRHYRKVENGQVHIPIVVLTGYQDEAIKTACLEAGADAVFLKPITKELFADILKQYVRI